MKTKLINKTKKVLLAFLIMLLPLIGFSKEHVTMSLNSITTTSNTIEYDLYIVNDGSTTIKLSACSYGVNFENAILNGGSITYSYQENSSDELQKGLTSFSVATKRVGDIHQARMTSTPSPYENSIELLSNIPFKIGRFKMTNSVSWTQNSKPNFSLQELKKAGLTVTQIIAYIGTNKNLVALTPTLTTVNTHIEESPILNPTHSFTNTTTSSNNAGSSLKNNILSNETSVKIYPNPVHDELKLDLLSINKSFVTITISDMQGRTVKQIQTNVVEGMNKINIDVSELSKGIFTVKITDNKSFKYNQTFTKQ